MNISGSKSGYVSIEHKQNSSSKIDDDDNKAQMSFNRLGILLAIIAIVWILCYNAQLQFPARHIVQTYNRIGQQKITKQTYKYAFQLLTSDKNSDISYQHKKFLTKKYDLLKQPQQNICVLLIHKIGQQNWMKSIQSLLNQQYKNYKIYYINNYKNGKYIREYIQKNSLDKGKFKIIQDIQQTDYTKQFQYAKNYCNSDDITIYMYDDDQLIGSNVFSLVNIFFRRDDDLKLLFSGSLYAQTQSKNKSKKQKKLKTTPLQSISTSTSTSTLKQSQKGQTQKIVYRLGKSYPYPKDIVIQNKYKQYPYLMDGLVAFRGSMLQQIDTIDLLNSKKQLYKYANQVIFGVNLLQLAKQNIKYLPQLLILRGKQRNFITNDKEFKEELKDIATRE